MSEVPDNEQDLPSTGLQPESQGGAGMAEEGAPIGFGAEVGGSPPGSTDDPDELREEGLDASRRGPVQTSERRDSGEDEDDRPWVG